MIMPFTVPVAALAAGPFAFNKPCYICEIM